MADIDEFECFDATTPDEIARAAHHKIDILAELLVDKGIITKKELLEKMDEMAIVDEVSDEEEVYEHS